MAEHELTLVIRARDMFSRVITSATSGVKSFFGALVSGAAAGAAVGAVAESIRILASAARALVSDWEASARAYGKMTAILQQTGYAAGITSREAMELAASLQRTTGASDEATASVIALMAAQQTIKGDNLKRAAELAIDLAEGMRRAGQESGNLEEMARSLGLALADPERGMSRLTRMGIILTDSQTKLAKEFARNGETAKAQGVILDALQASYGGAAAAANRATGGLATLRETIGDLREALGTAIAHSNSFKAAVLAIQDAGQRLLASGAIEMWAERAKTALASLAPAAELAIGAIKTLMSATAQTGGFIGGLMGGQGIGEAWAARKENAAAARQSEQDAVAEMRARLAEEAAARDAAERAAAQRAADAQRKDKIGAIDAILSGASADMSGLQASVDEAVAKVQTKEITAKIVARLDLDSAQNAEDIVASVQDQLNAMYEDAYTRRNAALEEQRAALEETGAMRSEGAATDAAAAALADREKQLAAARAELQKLQERMAKASQQVTIQDATTALAGTTEYLQQARESLRQKQRDLAKPLEYSMAGPYLGSYREPTPAEIQTEAERLAEEAAANDVVAQSREMKARQAAARARYAQQAEQKRAEIATIQSEVSAEQAAIEAERKRLETGAAEAEASAARAGRLANEAGAEMAALIAAGERVDKGAAEKVREQLAAAERERERAAKVAAIDRQLAALAAQPDYLLRDMQPTVQAQAEAYMDRSRRDADTSRQDLRDAKRQADLERRLDEGRSVTKEGLSWLESRKNLQNAQAMEQDKAARQKALEEQRAALAEDGWKDVKEIRDLLEKNLQAS
jgi:hypothetical protein